MKPSEQQWDTWREQLWLPKNVIPLNAGTCSPMLKPVFNHMTELRQKMAADPQEFIWSSSLPLIEAGRAAMAGFLKCDQQQLLLLSNVSYAMNVVAQSIDFSPGDEIIMTDQEYGHFEALWRRIQKKRGLIFKLIQLPGPHSGRPSSNQEILAGFTQAITATTKAVVISHVTYGTGTILPVREVCAAAKAAGILSIVDGAHAAGMIDVDLQSIGADFYCGTAHKWMMGAVGTGYLWAARERRLMLRPLITTSSWEYDRKLCDAGAPGGGTLWQRSHEYQGTQDRAPQMALKTSLEFSAAIGWENIRARMLDLQIYARTKIQGAGFQLLSPGGEFGTALSAFKIPLVNRGTAERWFHLEGGIELAFSNLASVGPFMRVSTAWFNRKSEIDQLAALLPKVPWGQLV